MSGTVVVVAHPDDETLGLGARLERLRSARFVHLTDGAPADGADARGKGFATVADYARARRAELLAVLEDAGIDPDRAIGLGCPDQQVVDRLETLLPTLRALLADAGTVFTHPYEGGHPDHDATALLVRLAAPPGARIVEMAGYHRGPDGRPETTFLPAPGAGRELVAWLTAEERATKARRLALFASQQPTLDGLGPPVVERFRMAPDYDFTRPPHAGPVLYASFAWSPPEEQVRARFAEVLG